MLILLLYTRFCSHLFERWSDEPEIFDWKSNKCAVFQHGEARKEQSVGAERVE